MAFLPTICGGDQIARLLACVDQVLAIDGEIWECGVFQGGSASHMHHRIRQRASAKVLRLFDTFGGGMPVVGEHDMIARGRFAISNDVRQTIETYFSQDPNVTLHPGVIPETFHGLENKRVALAHIDVDVFETYNECFDFIWPRLSVGGFLVFDDYGVGDCPGATLAVDAFVSQNNLPLVLTPGWGATVQKGTPT